MSSAYLTQYATRAIWCSPFEDETAIIELKRISHINGSRVMVDVFDDDIPLPTEDEYYHVYMIGANFPEQLSLPAEINAWTKLSEWSMVNKLNMYLYTENGILFPLSRCYVLREEDENFILAVPVDKKFPDLNEQKLFLHLYHNQFYTEDTTRPLNKNIVVLGARQDDPAAFQLAVNKEEEYRLITTPDDPLYRTTLINGKVVSDMSYQRGRIGPTDTFEFVVDGAIMDEAWFRIDTLPHFESELDRCRKYLLHWPKKRNPNKDLLYRDDITLYIIKAETIEQEGKAPIQRIVDGRYYHFNREEALRMVTHQDWSVPVDFVRSYIRDVDSNLDTRNWYIRVQVRRSGLDRQLINERSHIRELYRLEDKDIVRAMIGTDATIPYWQAANLEKSSYTYLMRCYRHEITEQRVFEALGYVTSARVVANPCGSIVRNPNGDYFNLPVGLMTVCTVYEYDRFGLLKGFYVSHASATYKPKHPETIYIEAIAGIGSSNPDVRVNPSKEERLFPLSQYRAYVSELDERGVVTTWRDVTKEGSYFHQTEDNLGICKYSPEIENMILIGDGHFLSYSHEMAYTDGVLDLTLLMGESRTPLLVPFGKIDLWLNGRALVEGIDYHVDYPAICIVSKKYINYESETQLVTIRATGFCSKKMERIKPREIGFIAHGKISVDSHYDLHDEQVSRIALAGGIVDPRLLNFDLKTGEANVRPLVDGSPYAIEDFYIPLHGLRDIRLYDVQEEDRERFVEMTDYLTSRIPPVRDPGNPVIPSEYFVYSPFMASIYQAIKDGDLDIGRINYRDKMQLDKLIAKYKRWLKVDSAALGYNEDFVTVQPYIDDEIQVVTSRVYGFLETLNKLYLRNAIKLNLWLKVSN